MKKIKYFKIFIASGLVVMSTSCSKDFLDVEPYGKSPAVTYYKTDAEADLATYAAYDIISADQFQGAGGAGWSSNVITRLLCSDETTCGGGGSSDQSQYQAIDKYNWQPNNPEFKAYYSKGYFGIFRCNEIITNVPGTTSLQKSRIAEAKFLRAYYYFELTQAFGDVPMPLTPATDLTTGNPKVKQAQVFTQIEKDLTEAISVLPNKQEYKGADKFRANKQAAQALLGKTYLYAKDYPNAKAAFDQVIATETVQVGLEPEFKNVTRLSSEFGMESLFEANFVKDNYNWGNVTWDRVADDNRHIQLSGPRAMNAIILNPGTPQADTLKNTSGIVAGWGFLPPTQKLFKDLDDADPRKAFTVIDSTQLAAFGVNFVDDWDTQSLIRTKYTTFTDQSDATNGNSVELNYGTNWRLIRYADVLLMDAEASLDIDNANSLVQINKVRARAGATLLSGTVTLADIVKEREIELAYEGHRFFDLVRWGLDTKENLGAKYTPGKNNHFPIPTDELNGNSALTPADQNPGY